MKKTILIVDDFENTRWVIKNSLATIDCETLQAGNGVEALKLFDGRNIDLLITDLNMPEMNGIQLIDEVRKLKHYEFIPIIMLTTERNAEKLKKTEDLHVTALINKPFEVENFKKIIIKCLNQAIR